MPGDCPGQTATARPHGWLQPRQKYISLQDLAGQAMVGLEGHDPLSPALENKLHALRPAPVIHTRVQTHQMMRSMVEAGEGLAIVDPFTALGAVSRARCLSAGACGAGQSLRLELENGEPSTAVQALLAIITEQAAAMLAN